MIWVLSITSVIWNCAMGTKAYRENIWFGRRLSEALRPLEIYCTSVMLFPPDTFSVSFDT